MAALLKKVPALVELAKPKLNVFVKYAKVELAPPMPADIPRAISDATTKIANLQKQTFRNWTVRDAAINTVVGLEVFCWFFIGECIGKGSLVGYQV
jgi:F-type H+-transporting ATPase subunit g